MSTDETRMGELITRRDGDHEKGGRHDLFNAMGPRCRDAKFGKRILKLPHANSMSTKNAEETLGTDLAGRDGGERF